MVGILNNQILTICGNVLGVVESLCNFEKSEKETYRLDINYKSRNIYFIYKAKILLQ